MHALWAGSVAALKTSEVSSLASSATHVVPVAKLLAGSAARAFGAVGGAALLIHGVKSLGPAQTKAEKLHATANVGWGLQAMAAAVPTSGMMALSGALGVAGAACQIAGGCKEIYDGHKQNDPARMKLGALNVTIGGLWMGGTVALHLNPAFFVGAHGAAMVAHTAYANREAIMRSGAKVGRTLSSGVARYRAQLRHFVSRGTAGVAQKLGALGERTASRSLASQ